MCIPAVRGASKQGHAQVILLTDADVDGAHIRTLLLTFLFRYARALFEAGHVYVGVPPLYRLEAGRTSQYLYSEAELRAALGGRDPSTVNIQRFKVCSWAPVIRDATWRRAASCSTCRECMAAGCGGHERLATINLQRLKGFI